MSSCSFAASLSNGGIGTCKYKTDAKYALRKITIYARDLPLPVLVPYRSEIDHFHKTIVQNITRHSENRHTVGHGRASLGT